MNAIILAAGRGSRLAERSNGLPKCLLRFGDRTIIEHQIASFRACGIRKIVVVVGYRSMEIRRKLDYSVRCIANPIYPYTNSLYSLWLARHHFRDGFVVVNGDVLFHPDILGRLLQSPYPDAIAIQRKTEFEEEEMKVRLERDRLLTITKAMSNRDADGESLGLAKFSANGAEMLRRAMRHLIIHGGARDWAPRAFDAIAPCYPIFCCDVEELPWIEIDFPRDIDLAAAAVWPQIRATAGAYALA